MWRFALFLLVLIVPCGVHGSILINEVAWMGTTVSPNDEWIELYNSGSDDIVVDGWTLSDGVSLEIKLAGTIGAGEYAVLERTDDDSAPGPAFLIYTGALSNDGRTLTLRRDGGTIEDQVIGGEGWENIGGNNTTKDTAQRTASGWVTGTPTPGKQNVLQGNSAPTSGTGGTTGGSAKPKSQQLTSQTIPVKNEGILKLTLDAPFVGYVNQVIEFKVVPSGVGKTIMSSLRYFWNFGDSHTAHGVKQTHTFVHPGEYIVVVEAEFAEKKARMRHEITILPVALSLSRGENNEILLRNTASYEVDISNYHIGAGTFFTFAPNTIMRPNATITVAPSRVQAEPHTLVTLYNSERGFVTSTAETEIKETETTTQAQVSTPLFSVSYAEAFNDTEEELFEDEVVLSAQPPVQIGQQTVQNTSTPKALSQKEKVLYALIILIVFGILTLYIRRVRH